MFSLRGYKLPKFPDKWEKRIVKTRTMLHTVYFVLVCIESGHLYGVAAGVLIILTIAEFFEDEGHH